MTDSNAIAFKAGLFIVLMTLAGAALVVTVGGGLHFMRSERTYTVTFGPGADLSGLAPDAPVRVLGVVSGRVTDVSVGLGANHEVEARVVIQLPEDVVLRQDAEVVAGSSLTGSTFLNVLRTGSGAEATVDTPVRGSVASIGSMVAAAQDLMPRFESALATIEQAAGSAQTTMNGIDGAVAEMQGALTELREPLRSTLADAGELADTLRERVPGSMDHLDRLTGEAVPATLKRIDVLAENGTEALTDVRASLKQASQSVERLPDVLERIGKAGDDAGNTLASIQRMVDSARPRLDGMLADAGDAAQSLDGAVGELRAAPWRLLYKPKARDEQRLATYAVARQYARGASDLERAAQALAVAGEEGADPQQLEALRGAVVSAYDRFAVVQAALFDGFE